MKRADVKKWLLLFLIGVTIIGCSAKDAIDGTIDNIVHTITGYWNNTAFNIPDNDSDGIDSTLSVDMHSDFKISSLYVRINVHHQAVGDLKISLTSPEGTSVDLIEYRGANNSVNGLNFEDNATTPIANYDTSIHTYKPEVPLSTFNEETPNGTWRLHVIDSQPANTGHVSGWQLQIDAGS